jgi:uncharacterized membrane protein
MTKTAEVELKNNQEILEDLPKNSVKDKNKLAIVSVLIAIVVIALIVLAFVFLLKESNRGTTGQIRDVFIILMALI